MSTLTNTDYGVRLNGYSISSSKSGQKLYSYDRWSDKEYFIGKVAFEDEVQDGSFKVRTWTLTNGKKYHYIS
jgi:hypothetical protein